MIILQNKYSIEWNFRKMKIISVKIKVNWILCRMEFRPIGNILFGICGKFIISNNNFKKRFALYETNKINENYIKW